MTVNNNSEERKCVSINFYNIFFMLRLKKSGLVEQALVFECMYIAKDEKTVLCPIIVCTSTWSKVVKLSYYKLNSNTWIQCLKNTQMPASLELPMHFLLKLSKPTDGIIYYKPRRDKALHFNWELVLRDKLDSRF